MPILSASALPNVELGLDLGSQLPDIAAISDAGTAIAGEAAARAWRRRGAEVVQRATQQTLGGIITTVGIPAGELRMIGGQAVQVVEAIGGAWNVKTSLVDVAKELLTDSELAQELSESAIMVASQMASAIPVIGAVIELVVGVVRTAVHAAREMKRKDRPPPIDRSTFSPERDAVVYSEIFRGRLQGGVNWTDIYLPPSSSPGYGRAKQAFTVRTLRGGGWSIRPSDTIEGALGQMPGSDHLHASLEFPEFGGPVDVGSYLPTARQQATWLWGQIAAGGPSAYTVHADLVAGTWGQYFEMLRTWVKSELGPKRSRTLTEWWKGRGVDLAAKPETWPPVAAAKALQRLQIDRLNNDPTMCAYVSQDHGALADENIRQLVRYKRSKLLESADALAKVDRDNVPDRELLAEIQRRAPARPFSSVAAPFLSIAGGRIVRPPPGFTIKRSTPGGSLVPWLVAGGIGAGLWAKYRR